MKIRKHLFCVLALLTFTLGSKGFAQSERTHHHEMSQAQSSMRLPVETGQSAFAAIAEIVAILDADPHTDWSGVSIDALRTHLIDMHEITLSSIVNTQLVDEQRIQFHVSGINHTVGAIKSMVPVHADMVSEAMGWKIEVTDHADGVTLVVDPGSAEALRKLKALGFFGFMTIGAHHQLHHLQIAAGHGH